MLSVNSFHLHWGINYSYQSNLQLFSFFFHNWFSNNGTFVVQHSDKPFPLHSACPWIWIIAEPYLDKFLSSFLQSFPFCWHSRQCLILLLLILGCSILIHLAEWWALQPLSGIRDDSCVILLALPLYCQLFHGRQVDYYQSIVGHRQS